MKDADCNVCLPCWKSCRQWRRSRPRTPEEHEGAGYHEALARDRAPELFAEQAKRPGRFRSSAAERESWVRSIQDGLSLDALALRVGGETEFQAAKARIWRAVIAVTGRTVGETRGQRCADCDTPLRKLRRDGLCAACRKARRARRVEETRATCASCGARLRLAARPDGKPRYCGRCHQVSNSDYLRRRAATDPVYIAFKRAHARWQQRFWAGRATEADKPYLRDYRRAAAAGSPLPNPVPLLREDTAP